MYTIPGHHHISMYTKSARENKRFYTEVLGLRLVKVSVNQDDPSMYHLFYGDKKGSPGTGLTFFEMPRLGHTQRGTDSISRIGLLVPSEESLDYWKDRFEALGVKHQGIGRYANRAALPFEDHEGLRMVLLDSQGQSLDFWEAPDVSPVPAQHRILGMGTIELTVSSLDDLANTLVGMFRYVKAERSGNTALFQSLPGEPFGEILAVEQKGERERPGKGSIHHLAIRVRSDEELLYWLEQVLDRDFRTTGLKDRYFFKSIYFREKNGILIEIATDEPGFTVDSSVEDLGTGLALPPFLESQRAEIESKLPPLE